MWHEILSPENYYWNPWAVPMFITSALVFLEGLGVYIKNTKALTNRMYGLWLIFVVIWLLGFGMVGLSKEAKVALFWYKDFTFLGVAFISFGSYLFSLTFLAKNFSRQKSLIVTLIFILGAFCFVNIYSDFIVKGVNKYFWGFYPHYTIFGGGIFLSLWIILYIGTVINLIKAHKVAGGIKRKQLFLILLGTIFVYAGAVDFIPVYLRIEVYPFGYMIVALYLTWIAYTIIRYHAFEIDTVVHKTALWIATSLWLIIPGYVMISFILPWLKTLPVLWFTVVELVLFYLFLNYYLIFQPKIDHLFRRRKYDYQTVLGKIAEKIATCINVEQLTEQLLTEINETIYLRNSLFYLLSREEQKYTLIGKRGSQTENEPANGAEFSIAGNPLCTWLNEHHDILDKELMETEQYFETKKDELLSWFEEQNLELLVPIIFEQKIIGLLGLGKKENLQHYTLKDKELLKKLGEETGVTLFNALHYKDILEKDRLEEEVKMGQQIQMNLLPQEMPHVPGLEIVGYIHPAKEIGGDYYDFISRPHNNEFGFVIGDVSGKGVAAGIVMSMVKMAINTLSQQMFSPREILCSTNASLFNQVKGEKFITLLYFLWQPRTQQLAYSSAGHEHILFYHSKEQRIEAIMSGGIMLGMLPDVSGLIEESHLSLSPGDKVLLYTDGVTEARNPQNELFTLERLTSLFIKYCSLAPNQLIENISKDIFSYMEGSPQYDDITLVAIEAKN